MEFSEALRRRRMIRRYLDRPLPPGALDRVAAAALRAPSAGFTQGVSLLVLASADERGTFWAASSVEDSAWSLGIRTAPALILVWTSEQAYLERYAEPDKGWTDRDPSRWSAPYWWVDAGMAAALSLLAAVDEGLGAAFFGVPPDRIDSVRAAFGVPPDQLSVGVLSVGYPDPAAGPSGSATRRRRKPPDTLVHHGTWHIH